MPTAIQVRRSFLNRFRGDRLRAGSSRERRNPPFQEVLVQATVLVEEPQGRLETMRERGALIVGQPFVIDTFKAIHHSDVAGLCQECGVIDKSPHCEQAVHATRVPIIAEDALDT